MPSVLQPYRHPLAQAVHDAFEQGRFLDAWSLAQPLHADPVAFKALTCEEQVLAARLSWSVGGSRLSRALYRQAERRDPHNPMVRLYQAGYSGKRIDYLAQLQDFEANPHFNSGNAACDAQWLAGNALLYNTFRDFERAHQVLDQAEQLAPDLAMIAMARGQIYLNQDAVDQAWHLAQAAWRRAPAFSSNFRLFLEVASRCNSEPQAAQALLDFVTNGGQSGHALFLALLTLCRGLERLPPREAAAAAARLEPHCARIPRLMPLVDKASERLQAALEAEFAKLTLNRKRFVDLAKKARLPYFDHLIDAYQRCPDGERLLLPHATPRQKHNTCVPGSITACLQTLGVAIDQDAVAAEITYDGTECWRVAHWAQKHNLLFYPFIASRDSHLALLRAGIPSVMTYHQAGNMGHAVAVVGYDEATDALIYHDPSSPGLVERALTALLEQNAPDGPLCFVVAPPEWRARIEAIALNRAVVAHDFLAFLEALSTQNDTVTRNLAAAFKQKHGDDPLAAMVTIHCAVMQGNWNQALDDVVQALQAAPKSLALTRIYLDIRARYHDSDAYERTLEAVVEGEPLPDLPVKVEAPWNTAAVAELANLLFQTRSSYARAEHFLNLGLSVNPAAAELLAVKVTLLSRRGQFEAASFFSRLTTTLEPTNPHFMGEHVWLLRKLGRREEALTLMAERAEKLCKQAGGTEGWINGVSLTAQFGEPDRAAALLKRGLMRRREDGDLWAFAANFCLQQGLVDSAEKAWQKTETYCQGVLKQRTGFYRFFHLGRYQEAAEYLENWLAAAPEDLHAREMKMAFVERVQGPAAARLLPHQWHRRHPDSKQLHLFYLQHDSDSQSDDPAALEAWLARHPRDGWGRRALLQTHLQRFKQAEQKERAHHRQQVEAALETAWSEDPFHPHTRLLKAQWLIELDDLEGAGTMLGDLLCDEPEDRTVLQLLAVLYQRRARVRRAEFVDILERCFTACRHDFELAPPAAFAVDYLLGFKAALALLQRWRAARPDDPYVIEAYIDLNMERGEGLRSLAAVKDLLAEMVARYPRHRGFAQSLIEYHRQAQQWDHITARYQQMVARSPSDLSLRLEIAAHQQRINQPEAAKRELAAVVRLFPFDEFALVRTCQMLEGLGCHKESETLLATALKRLPQSYQLHQLRLERLLNAGNVHGVRLAAFELGQHLDDPLHVARLQASIFAIPALEIGEARLVAVCETLLKLQPGDWDATRQLLEIYLNNEQLAKARALLRHSKRFNRDSVEMEIAETVLERLDGHNQRALERLIAILERDIYNDWGRSLAIRWIATDEATELGHDLLLFFDEELTCRESLAESRANLATVLGMPAEQIMAFWDNLIADFPHATELHIDYLGWLIEHQAWVEAQHILDKLSAIHSDPTVAGHYGLLLAAGRQDLGTVQRLLREFATGDGIWLGAAFVAPIFTTLCNNQHLHTLASRILQETGTGVHYHGYVYLALAEYVRGNQWLDICDLMLQNLADITAAWRDQALVECLNAYQEADEHEAGLDWLVDNHRHWSNSADLVKIACILAMERGQWQWVADWTKDWAHIRWENHDVIYMRILLERHGQPDGPDWHAVVQIAETIMTHSPQAGTAGLAFFNLCLAYLILEKPGPFQIAWKKYAKRYQQDIDGVYGVLELFVTLVKNPNPADRDQLKKTFKQRLPADLSEAELLTDLFYQYLGEPRGRLQKAFAWCKAKLKRR